MWLTTAIKTYFSFYHDPWFVVNAALIAVMFLLPSLTLLAEWNGRKLSKCFKTRVRAFKFHYFVTNLCWTLFFLAYIYMIVWRWDTLHHFDCPFAVQFVIAPILAAGGLIVATIAYHKIGLDASCCLNFFEDGLPIIEDHWVFRWFKEPEEYGFCLAMAASAVLCRSYCVVALSVELILLMLGPWQWIENLPIRRREAAALKESLL